jgi:hypothetical protein
LRREEEEKEEREEGEARRDMPPNPYRLPITQTQTIV